MPTPPKRVRLNARQKFALCQHSKAHPHLSIHDLCQWAGEEFALLKNPSRMAIHDLLKSPISEPTVRTRPDLKTAQPVASLQLEQQLLAWMTRCERLKLPMVTWASIRYKAAKLRRAILEQTSIENNNHLIKLRFSDGQDACMAKPLRLEKKMY
ncbi:hypothetical protein ACHHYP_20815 [Achlya hypogyna]|uniref:HTH CENPB-type domain-containing protein n=1 Tax=Achlya hypogyna TaxID=1202772 RepID=A0A1V9Y908_ACHHY|nr:hypothetical protein ACHHYP_20815 [Achlya hypogyna]